MRYFLHIGYDGTNYSGWQRQKSTSNTLQQVIEQELSRVLKSDIVISGCGRTDAGVHASQYVLQVDIEEAQQFDLKFRLNKNLPQDIAIYDIVEVDEHQHCRHHAVGRTYDYFLHWKKDPMLSRFSTFFDYQVLDFRQMKTAVNIIGQATDFKALCKSPDLYEHTRCKVSDCALFINEEQGRMRFSITSNRFLRGMIRITVFFLLKIGTGKLTIDQFERILNQEEIPNFEKKPAPPNGLFLSKIDYPFIEFEDQHQLIKMLRSGLK